MALLKKNEKDGLKAKVKKLDLEGMFNNHTDLLKRNEQALAGTSTGSSMEISKFVNSMYKENNSELQALIEKKLNELIPDEMVSLVNETLKAQQIKTRLEDEISELKRIVRQKGNNSSAEDEISTMKLELEIEIKEDELKEARKTFLNLYTSALSKTQISEELYEMFIQISSIRKDELLQLEEQIRLLHAKVNSLIIMQNSNILEDSKDIIDSRIKLPVIADQAISSSRQQIPLIKVLLNKN